PTAPACCMLAARGWRRAAAAPTAWPWTRLAIVATAALLVVAAVTAAAAFFLIDFGLSWTALALPLTLAAGGARLLRAIIREAWQPPRSPAVLISALVMAYASLVVGILPALEHTRPNPTLGLWLRDHNDPAIPVVIYGLHKWEATTRFYADRPVIEI